MSEAAHTKSFCDRCIKVTDFEKARLQPKSGPEVDGWACTECGKLEQHLIGVPCEACAEKAKAITWLEVQVDSGRVLAKIVEEAVYNMRRSVRRSKRTPDPDMLEWLEKGTVALHDAHNKGLI